MITYISAILLGFVGLIWSADRFVLGAAGIAKHIGMSSMMIGLTIVSLGTSAPEIIVSINAAIEQASSLAIGNAIGSNLANVGLVLGITAIVTPIPLKKIFLSRETSILLLVTIGAGFFLFDAKLSALEGAIFIVTLVVVLVFLVLSKSHHPEDIEEDEITSQTTALSKSWLSFFIGLALLIISADILVWGARQAATAWGVSELVIGLTVIAVGTSLPELAATVVSALKGHHDIALGNILGSNLFNLLAVMGISAMIYPPELESAVFYRDYIAMLLITVLLAFIMFINLYRHSRSSSPKNSSARIGRASGILLLSAYGCYYYFLFA